MSGDLRRSSGIHGQTTYSRPIAFEVSTDRRELIVELVVLNVSRWSLQSVLVENGSSPAVSVWPKTG